MPGPSVRSISFIATDDRRARSRPARASLAAGVHPPARRRAGRRLSSAPRSAASRISSARSRWVPSAGPSAISPAQTMITESRLLKSWATLAVRRPSSSSSAASGAGARPRLRPLRQHDRRRARERARPRSRSRHSTVRRSAGRGEVVVWSCSGLSFIAERRGAIRAHRAGQSLRRVDPASPCADRKKVASSPERRGWDSNPRGSFHRPHDFQSCTLSHSVTPPGEAWTIPGAGRSIGLRRQPVRVARGRAAAPEREEDDRDAARRASGRRSTTASRLGSPASSAPSSVGAGGSRRSRAVISAQRIQAPGPLSQPQSSKNERGRARARTIEIAATRGQLDQRGADGQGSVDRRHGHRLCRPTSAR